MPAVKTGFTPPPMPGMPAPMAPMGGMPPMGGGMPRAPAPNPFAPMPPAPLAGPQVPPPMPMQPIQGQGQPMQVSTAGRRRRFGDALEGMLGRNQGIGAVVPQQRPLPMPQMMPQQRMVAPGTPMMQTPSPRPMAMGGEVDIFGYADGGIVQYYEDAGEVKKPSGLIKMAVDSEGNKVPGMFVTKFNDGTYSAPYTASELVGLRSRLLSGELTSGDYTADEAARLADDDIYLKSDDITVVDRDITGGFGSPLGMSNEMLGNDTVHIQFGDGSKVTAQKGMVDAMNEYGLLEGMGSRDDFNKVMLDMNSASVSDPQSDLAAASRLANDKIIAYNEALKASDPNIQKNIDAFRAYYAPKDTSSADDSDVSGGVSAASYPSVSVDQTYGSEAGAGTAVGAGGNFGTGSYVADPVDVSEINPINYAQFQGDVGLFSGTPENFGLFGPSVSIPQSVSQYMTDPVTGGLTTSYGPQMASVSPIGGIKLPARPVTVDIFDWLSTPTYGTMYSSDPYSLEPEGLAMGGEVAVPFRDGGSVPRRTEIMGQPHMLAYINPAEEKLLRGLGGSGISGPGGIPSYPPIGPSGYVSLDAIADAAVKSDPNMSFSHMGKSYDNVADFHDAIFGGNDDDEDYTPTAEELSEQLAAAGKDDKRSDVSVVDYTQTGSGKDYTSAAESDTDVSGAEFVSGSTIADLTDDDESGVNIFEPTLATDEVLPAPITDMFGNEYSTRAAADRANRAYLNALRSDTQDVVGGTEYVGVPYNSFEYTDIFGNTRFANLGDVIPNQNLPSLSTASNPFAYTNIGGIGSSDITGGGSGAIAPISLTPVSQKGSLAVTGNKFGIPSDEYDFNLESLESPTNLDTDVNLELGPSSVSQNVLTSPSQRFLDINDPIPGELSGVVYSAFENLSPKDKEFLGELEGNYVVMKDGNILPIASGDLDYNLNEVGKTRDDILFMGTKAAEKFGPEAEQFKGAIDEAQPAIDSIVNEIYTGQGKVPETSVVSGSGVTAEEIKSQISGDAEPTGLEAFFYDVIGNLGFGLGKGLADNLRNTSKENRQAIINQHVYALQNGATPKTDEEGNYIGFDISTMDTFGDKVLAADDITQFLPPSMAGGTFTVTQDMIDQLRATAAGLTGKYDDPEIAAKLNAQADALTVGQTLNLPAYSNPAYQADADGDGVPDYERFGQVFDAQSVAAGADPYGMSTEQGFITSDGKEFFVDASGKVVEVTDGTVPYEVGGGQSVDEALGLTKTITDDDSGETKNYTMGPDGTIVCNDEGYVYNPETDMCEPPAEEEGSDTVSFPTLSRDPYRSFEDIMASITTSAPTIAPISANIRPMQGGGMAGLNRAADNFLKALAG